MEIDLKIYSKKRCKALSLLLLFLLSLFFSCNTFVSPGVKSQEPSPIVLADCPIPVETGKIYGNYGKKADTEQILGDIKKIINGICEGNLNFLPDMVFGELGLFIEVKGHWTKEEVTRDLSLPDGYFATYFFNQSLLDQKKGSSGNLTVQTVIRSSHGIIIDYFFDSAKETEIQLKFKENAKNSRYLVNPVFAKIEGRWMLLRML